MPTITINLIIGIIFLLNVTPFLYTRILSTRTKYDSRGKVLLHAGIKPDGSLEKDYYVREFDLYGNLVKEICWRKVVKSSGQSAPLSEWLKDEGDKGKMIQLIDRKISYYK
ncbi:MAG: hypothetical protein MOB07_10590 [Acidobacteria bacterium]|nr:hypothetical protein [Acidobacteriota bacterium]